MSSDSAPQTLILPRPGRSSSSNNGNIINNDSNINTSNSSAPPITTTPIRSIPAPAESAFTSVFGTLLPPAQYITTDHGKTAYYSLAPPPEIKNPAKIILIHGIQTPALGLLPLARTLQSNHPTAPPHVILVDLFGHGLSSTPIAPHTPQLFHFQIEGLLLHLRWSSAHFIGFLFGACVVAGYLARQPQRGESAVFIAPAGFLKHSKAGVEAGLDTFLARQQQRDVETETQEDYVEARDWIVRFLEGGGDLVVPRDWNERVRRGEVVAEALRDWQTREHAGHTASVIAIFRDAGVVDSEVEFESVARTGIRSLVVLGGNDGLNCEGDFRKVGLGNVVVVDGAGHAVVRERVPEVADAIEEFYKTLEL